MKNLKASIPVEFLTGASFNFYAWVCGAILARAHSRTGDPARIAGYCGKSDALDEALSQWAEHYGDQMEEDHASLLASIKRGETKADVQPDEGS
jgi:NAD(P)H-dependent flavin oxidoreductase YrpB (nitropropane dioxygenase family)